MAEYKGPARTQAPADRHTAPIFVVLADSSEIYATGMGAILRKTSGRFSIATLSTMRSLSKFFLHNGAHLLILDDDMVLFPEYSIRNILRRRPRLRIIVVYSNSLSTRAARYYGAGVSAMVRRDIADSAFAAAVVKVLQEQEHPGKEILKRTLQSTRETPEIDQPAINDSPFSQRESLIIGGAVAGKMNKEIAADIGTSEQVVKNILVRIYRKFGVRTKIELVTLLVEPKETATSPARTSPDGLTVVNSNR